MRPPGWRSPYTLAGRRRLDPATRFDSATGAPPTPPTSSNGRPSCGFNRQWMLAEVGHGMKVEIERLAGEEVLSGELIVPKLGR